MKSGEYAICSIAEHHDVDAFDCGKPDRNIWLSNRALANRDADFSRTYVAAQGSAVFGFFALTVGSVLRTPLPSSLRRNAPNALGCVLLAQLAVDQSCQGLGVGRALVLHAMNLASRIAELAGSPLFAVNPAHPNLVEYYRKFEFISVEATPPLMVMPMKKVRAILTAIARTSAEG